MKKVLIFAGTTEGRRLAERMAKAGVPTYVCVATEYGEQIIPPMENLTVYQGRLDGEEMKDFIAGQFFSAVVDATHPYATEVSENIRFAAEALNIPCLRLKRRTTAADEAQAVYVEDSTACAEALKQIEGNILLTTGSKELTVYCAENDLRGRLYVRVLPSPESLEACYANGLSGNQILAMQGPFSTEMNLAMIRQYRINCLVTKETGTAGGFAEKMEAVRQAGIRSVVIGNPDKGEGLRMREVMMRLEEITGAALEQKRSLNISLAGIGMGSENSMTEEVRGTIREADLIFGAERMLENIPKEKQTYPAYLAKEIIPRLEQFLEETDDEQINVCVLFSGDSGFYSGCQSVYDQLREWGISESVISAGTDVSVRVMPGISSVSCLASRAGIAWQDAAIVSLHGRRESGWRIKILQSVRAHLKTFVLLSGVEQMRELGALLEENDLSECQVLVGYQLSYDDEQISLVSPSDCRMLQKEGLYTCLIFNDGWQGRLLTAGMKDESFVRGKVPMTKEEVRTVSVSKLRLRDGAVVYDIGSGTGSVAAEIGSLSPNLQIYAIEKGPEACSLIRKNCGELGLDNVYLIGKEAPEGLQGLPAATHAFIGGSGGRLTEILEALYRINPRMRLVINAVSLETIGEIRTALEAFPTAETEYVQMQVSRSRQAGNYHLMQGENPVLIASCRFDGKEAETEAAAESEEEMNARMETEAGTEAGTETGT